jgi:transcription-repair coupling factor (superfamily II helicase)
MNEDAQKRLQAISEFTELGSGYKIAQRDLMIRGAGDILGPEQAGFIDTVGLDLYMKMLNEAISAKKSGIPTPEPKPNKLFDIDAYIPKDYAINSDKIELYQDLENVKDDKELATFTSHLRDVYGKIPPETQLLLQKKRMDLIANSEEFTSVEEADAYVDILMSDTFSRIGGIGVELFNAVVPFMSFLKVTYLERQLRLRMTKQEHWLDDLEKLLKVIHVLYLKHKEGDVVLN